MAKVYNITDGMIGSLHQGQVFKNFGELSRFLNVLDSDGKPLTSNSKNSFLEELDRYVLFKKDGRQFIIMKIRSEDEILPELPSGGNKKYIENIQRLLVYCFNSMCEQTGCNSLVILWEKLDVWQTIGMINNDYKWWGYTEETKDDMIIAEAFRKLAGSVKLKRWLDSALYGLYGKDALTVKEERAFIEDIGEDEKRMTLLTDEQNAIYTQIKSEVLNEYFLSNCKTVTNEADLWRTGRMRDFFRQLNPRLEKAFSGINYNRIQKVYKIIVEPTSMKLFLRRFGKIDPADTKTIARLMLKLNDIVCDGMMTTASLNREAVVAYRIRDHKEVMEQINARKQWGGINRMKIAEEREKRREFKYENVVLNGPQKKYLIDNMVRINEEDLMKKLNKKPDIEDWHCQIVKKFNACDLLRDSGFTEEQCKKIMQDAAEDEEKEKADMLARFMLEQTDCAEFNDLKEG